MIMKKYYILLCSALLISVVGCRKQENIDFKFDTELDYVPTELDHWLTENFTDPYNMEIIYRFDRYKMGELNVNLSPPKEEKVKEQMEMIDGGFIKPFEKGGGVTFAKTFLPKEWMLSGSLHINSSGERILATSSGGRNITIHEVNTVDVNDIDVTRRKLKTVHHEFAHTLTQLIRIPREFESISEANYSASWSNSSVWPDAKNNEQGFVSRYARSSVMEDFAETVGFLVAYGQGWYDAKAAAMPKSGSDILKQKEAVVVKFYRDNYGVDFRKLQQEVTGYIGSHIQKVDFKDWFFDAKLSARTLNITKSVLGTEFSAVFENFKTRILGATYGPYVYKDMNFIFTPTNATSGKFDIKVTSKVGVSPDQTHTYTFSYQIDPSTQRISFTKITQTQSETGGQYGNQTMMMPHFLATISAYFTSSPFMMDWSLSKPMLTFRDQGYYDFGGFYKANNRNDYIDFGLVQ